MSTIHLTKVSKEVRAKHERDKRILCKDARRGKWKGRGHPNVRPGPQPGENILRLRNGGEIQHRKAHLKREALCEVRPQHLKLAWRVWTLDKLLHAGLDVHRAPQSVGRPPGGEQTGDDKGKAMPPVSGEVVSKGDRTYMWGMDSKTS